MDADLPPDLDLQVRKIRNIEVWKSDLLPLIVGKQKIPSTPINVFGAQLDLGLTTVPYTATAVQNTALYGYAPYRKKAVLTKSWLATVRLRL